MRWFSVQIDRDFYTGTYGQGTEIYIEDTSTKENMVKLKHGVISSGEKDSNGTLILTIKYPEVFDEVG